jgi:hypothetical protein
MTAMLINTELSADRVRSAVSLILDTLGEPQTDAQRMALEASRADDKEKTLSELSAALGNALGGTN